MGDGYFQPPTESTPLDRSPRRIFTLMAQATWIRARMCPSGVSLTLLPILGVKYPKNPNFWGVNGRFQAKRAKY